MNISSGSICKHSQTSLRATQQGVPTLTFPLAPKHTCEKCTSVRGDGEKGEREIRNPSPSNTEKESKVFTPDTVWSHLSLSGQRRSTRESGRSGKEGKTEPCSQISCVLSPSTALPRKVCLRSFSASFCSGFCSAFGSSVGFYYSACGGELGHLILSLRVIHALPTASRGRDFLPR